MSKRISYNELEVDGHVYRIEDDDGEEEKVEEESSDDEDLLNNVDEENVMELEEEDLFNKNTESFKCLAQILISRSSLLRHVMYHFPELKDPGIDAAFNYQEPKITYDDVGVEKYKNDCKELKVLPITRVIKSLGTNELNLKYYGLTGPQVRTICSTLMLNNRIKTLILQDNWMNSEGTYWVGEMLRENNSIELLNMSECRIGIEGVKNMFEGLSLNLSLKELDLSFNNLGDEGLELLIKALKENQQIKVLNLSHNNLAEGAGKCLGIFLADNLSVEVLDLSWNDLYSKGAMKDLCVGLTLNTVINYLNLAWNGIGSRETLGPIIKYLKSTTILEHLDLSHNRIMGEGVQMVRSGILNNYSLLSINLGFNLITPENALYLINLFTNVKREEPLNLKYLDLENVFVNKNFVPVWKKVTKMDKSVRIEGILCNFTINGPNVNKVLFERAKFLAQKPKSIKMKKDFGHFIYQLPEKEMDKQDFQKLLKKKKLKVIDKDLSSAIADKFKQKSGKIDVNSLKKAYLEMYPETQPPPIQKKEKKGKKGRKKKKNKEPQELETETREMGMLTEPTSQDNVEIKEIKASVNKIDSFKSESEKSFSKIHPNAVVIQDNKDEE